MILGVEVTHVLVSEVDIVPVESHLQDIPMVYLTTLLRQQQFNVLACINKRNIPRNHNRSIALRELVQLMRIKRAKSVDVNIILWVSFHKVKIEMSAVLMQVYFGD